MLTWIWCSVICSSSDWQAYRVAGDKSATSMSHAKVLAREAALELSFVHYLRESAKRAVCFH